MSFNAVFNTEWSVCGAILDLVFEMRNLLPSTPAALQLGHIGGRYHFDIIARAVAKNQSITMILPAFPAKSPNREKTLTSLPDLGEVLALKRLQALCESIGKVYSPGAEVIICSDGRVFSDLVQVPDHEVTAYSEGIRKILQTFGLDCLKTFDLDDVIPGADFETMRTYLVDEFSETVETVKNKVITDPEFKQLFNGIHRFLFEDLLVLKPGLSRNQAREQSKKLAYQVIQRSNAWSALLENHFDGVLRLSIHPQAVTSRKIGVRLLPSEDIWRTPWHSVPVFDGKAYRLLSRKDAEAQGGAFTLSAEGYGYFSIETQPFAKSFAQTEKGGSDVTEYSVTSPHSVWA